VDRDVVERARSGDQEAFATLVYQVSDTLLGIARRIIRDPGLAEDVLQNALLTIWRKLPHLRDADRFEGWAFRILVHACYADAPRNRRWASTIRVLHVDIASDVDPGAPLGLFDLDAFEGRFDVEFSAAQTLSESRNVEYAAADEVGLNFVVDPEDSNKPILGTGITSRLPD